MPGSVVVVVVEVEGMALKMGRMVVSFVHSLGIKKSKNRNPMAGAGAGVYICV